MALSHSSTVITDGLVFYYDMGNTKKSWKGWPVTNQFTLPTSATNGFGVQNSTFTRVYSGSYGGYDIQPGDYVWRYDVSVNDCPYHGWDIPTTAGAVLVFSFDYYVSPTITNYPVTNFLANIENAGSGTSGSYVDPTPSITGVWKRGYIVSTATATGNSRCLLYPGACGGRLGDAGFILYKNPQVEFNPAGSVPSPFVAGTRSNTQAIVDLTGNNTATVNSLTYNSDGTISFLNNSGISVPSIDMSSGQTIEIWLQPLENDGNRRNPYNQAYGGYGTWTHEPSGSINYYYGNSGSDTTPYTSLSSANVNQNEIACMCVTRSTSTVIWYKNGTATGSMSNPYGVLAATSAPITIGNGYAGTYYGNIFAVKLYNRALSATEVQQNFNALRGRYGV